MNPKTRLYALASIALTSTLLVSLFAVGSFHEKAVGAGDTSYTLTLDKNNGQIGSSGAGYNSGVIATATTTSGNAFSVTYSNVCYAKDTYAQLKASTGSLYSTYGVVGLTSVKVTYTSSTALSLYTSDSSTFSGTATSLTSGSAVAVSQNFFKIAAGSK